jgi:hypothetical protein
MLNATALYHRYTNLYSSLQFLDIHFGKLQQLSELLRWPEVLLNPKDRPSVSMRRLINNQKLLKEILNEKDTWRFESVERPHVYSGCTCRRSRQLRRYLDS